MKSDLQTGFFLEKPLKGEALLAAKVEALLSDAPREGDVVQNLRSGRRGKVARVFRWLMKGMVEVKIGKAHVRWLVANVIVVRRWNS